MLLGYFLIFNLEIQRPWELSKAVASQNSLARVHVLIFHLFFNLVMKKILHMY